MINRTKKKTINDWLMTTIQGVEVTISYGLLMAQTRLGGEQKEL